MANVIRFPAMFGPVRKRRRLRHKPTAPVVSLSERRPQQSSARQAYDLYLQASAIDETDPEAGAALYERALAIDPMLSIAHTNLGNIRFRMHDPSGAEILYNKALTITPEQPEALYNLGYLTLERGFALRSIPLFRRAVVADPRFADAWFNLAMALEQIHCSERAEPCWRRYVELEPAGVWAEIARRHIG